ncbi:MAG: AraC family transcriptional regulator [Myxococcota bacterium]
MSDLANLDAVARVNRVIDHVTRHPTDPLDLEQLSGIAHYSSYHFHRVFKAVVGETLAVFVKRIRLQRALQQMSHDPEASLTEIAFACGFSSSSDFSRSFKQQYGVPPRAFDLTGFRDARREAFTGIARLPPGTNPDGFAVTFRELPARFVAYIRVHASYTPGGPQGAAERLVRWAEARGWDGGRWLGYMWDDPEVVPMASCRYDVGVEVPASFRAEGEVGCLALPAMTVARVPVRGPIELELRALDWLYGTWLPRSTRVPAHLPCFEAWRGRPFAHGDGWFELDLELPVVEPGGARVG